MGHRLHICPETASTEQLYQQCLLLVHVLRQQLRTDTVTDQRGEACRKHIRHASGTTSWEHMVQHRLSSAHVHQKYLKAASSDLRTPSTDILSSLAASVKDLGSPLNKPYRRARTSPSLWGSISSTPSMSFANCLQHC